MNRALVILYLFEVGLLLVVVPWTGFWERNYFIQSGPVEAILTSPVTRGSVSGVGLVSLAAAIVDAVTALRARWRA